MPTIRGYLEQTYGAPSGFPPLVRHQRGSSDHDPMPSSPPVSAAYNTPSSSPQPLSPQAISSDTIPHPQTTSDTESDTEPEDNTEMEEYYLSKPSKPSRDVGTVFGRGIRVWRSHSGTIYPYIVCETINGAVMMPRKRKQTHNQRFTASFLSSHPPAPALAHRVRAPENPSTIFHHGSAAIDPRGAYARPVPLLLRGKKRESGESSAEPQFKARKIVSGSFGTFEGQPGRFSERPYRLLQGPRGGKEGEEGRVFEARP
jgi:hypothetical protein